MNVKEIFSFLCCKETNEKGIATVEFALILPVLATLSFGIVDFGMLMTNQASLVNASRDGARAGILLTDPPMTETDITAVVKDALTNSGWKSADVDAVVVTVTGAGGSTGMDLTVKVDSNYTFFIISKLIPSLTDTLPISASTTMKHE